MARTQVGLAQRNPTKSKRWASLHSAQAHDSLLRNQVGGRDCSPRSNAAGRGLPLAAESFGKSFPARSQVIATLGLPFPAIFPIRFHLPRFAIKMGASTPIARRGDQPVNSDLIDFYDDGEPAPAKLPAKLAKAALGLLLLTALCAGWALREQTPLVAGEGLGYGLGIAGLALLLVSLPFAVTRRAAVTGGLRYRMAAVLGLAAPVLVLYHGNFHWGMPASALALATVLLSVASAWCGRGLTEKLAALSDGKQRDLAYFQTSFDAALASIQSSLAISPALLHHLRQLEAQELGGPSRRLKGLRERVDTLRQRSMKFLRDVLESQAAAEDWSSDRLKRRLAKTGGAINAYLNALAALAEFRVYRRLYGLWRLAHLLLAAILLLAAGAHVFSVHAY